MYEYNNDPAPTAAAAIYCRYLKYQAVILCDLPVYRKVLPGSCDCTSQMCFMPENSRQKSAREDRGAGSMLLSVVTDSTIFIVS